MKYADANIVFGIPSEPQIPSVAFGVGLLESREDLRIDASQWLMHTGKSLVVLVDVKEDWKAFFLPAKIRRNQREAHDASEGILQW